MRFLFTTLQDLESDFYGRVGQQLKSHGHTVAHVSQSKHAARKLGKLGPAYRLPGVMADLGEVDIPAEAARIERQYDTPHLRDVYKTDHPCYGKPESWCIERTVRHFLALEKVFDEQRPEIVVPEVGSEMMRTITHLISLDRGIRILFLLYTIFPKPLRLYENTLHAPIVSQDEVRELSAEERTEIEDFIERFINKRKPIRQYRTSAFAELNPEGWKLFLSHLYQGATDRDNPYMRPIHWAVNRRKERARSIVAKRLYQPLPTRPFVYFPLHVTDDYKIKRVIPHTVDQASLIEQVADTLPQGYDIVLKEHPMSVGRNSLALLRRLRKIPNARLVDPYTSSHDLMQKAEAIVVISSTVGLEALMYNKPVLTMGQPFYGGYGVTLDIDSFREIREKVPAVLEFKPDYERILQFLHASMRRCYEGAPVLVDSSDENAAKVARSLDRAAREGVPQAHDELSPAVA